MLLLLAAPVALLGRRHHPVAVMWIAFIATLGPRTDGFAYISLILSFFSATIGGHRRAGWVLLVAGYVGSLWLAPLVLGQATGSLGAALTLGGWLAVLAVAAEAVADPPRADGCGGGCPCGRGTGADWGAAAGDRPGAA